MTTQERIAIMLRKVKPIFEADKEKKRECVAVNCGNCSYYMRSIKSCWVYPLLDNLDRFTVGCNRFHSKQSEQSATIVPT